MLTSQQDMHSTLHFPSQTPHAIQVLSEAFTRLKKTQGSKDYVQNTAVLLGQALLESGRAAEAEAHFCACLVPGRKNPQILFGEDFVMMSTIFLAEALVRQGQTEEALALVEGMEGFSSYVGDWTEYCHNLLEEIREYRETYGTAGPKYSPQLFSMLRDKNKRTTAGVFPDSHGVSGGWRIGGGRSPPLESRGRLQAG